MQRLTSFVVRPRHGALVVIAALVITSAVGCGHNRRASMRPVFVTPTPVAAPGCATPAVIPETVTPAPSASYTPTPSAVEPTRIEPGGTGRAAPPAERIPSATPEPAGPGAGASGSPRSSAVDEPSLLEPVVPSSGKTRSNSTQTPPSSSLTVPRLIGPGASLNGGAPRKVPKVSLRERLSPYTNNPDDLFAPPKADRPWKYVVLHHSASATGNYESIDREHRKRLGWDGCGYHFVIGNGTSSPDGQIEVARRWSEQKHGIHCHDGKNPDVSEYGIGICLIGDLEKNPPTPRQIAAAQALVAYLETRYQIASDHVGTHTQLARNPTDCPGKNFPTQAILGLDKRLTYQ